MGRKKQELEPLRVVKREHWEDEEYTYEKKYFNRGGTQIDMHPKHPKIPKEEVFKIVGPMLLDAWRRAKLNQMTNTG